MKIIIGFSAALFLISGCAHKPAVEVISKVETRQIQVPEALLSCMPEPEAREVWKSQKDVALYLIRVSEAGEDCRQRLDGVRKILDQK
ncbi:Rz1-like lysis system protein LysC [Ochrobactrum soli]|uniref:Rz1-like lysis system protein LysC n=1 Tax=Ochrobactrum soli TaxID=2448455 RepID=UPI000D698829|nr:hypothetical protein [[Ochrobactrum] soli]